eukprot:297751-Pleurochrysis_carterae.AAC.3
MTRCPRTPAPGQIAQKKLTVQTSPKSPLRAEMVRSRRPRTHYSQKPRLRCCYLAHIRNPSGLQRGSRQMRDSRPPTAGRRS